MFRNSFQEEPVPATTKDSKLNAVFSKLTGVFPRAEDFNQTNNKIMSSDIIESVLVDTPVPVTSSAWNNCIISEENDCTTIISTLSQLIEMELRSAKRTHLSCCEVLLPCGLLNRISRDIVSMAESEPCGLRGLKLYMLFETTENLSIKLGTIQYDPQTASTFELYLTLKQTASGWNFLPQFLRNLTRSGTIVIGPAYILSKKKLYRSFTE